MTFSFTNEDINMREKFDGKFVGGDLQRSGITKRPETQSDHNIQRISTGAFLTNTGIESNSMNSGSSSQTDAVHSNIHLHRDSHLGPHLQSTTNTTGMLSEGTSTDLGRNNTTVAHSNMPMTHTTTLNTNPSHNTHSDKYTNIHQRPNKKRKSNVRACDACAIRKVKCETQRPCSHCVSNGLNCTQLRERKKSGPKNLHKKTLHSINSLSEVIDFKTGPSKTPPLGSVPMSSMGSVGSSARVISLVPPISVVPQIPTGTLVIPLATLAPPNIPYSNTPPDKNFHRPSLPASNSSSNVIETISPSNELSGSAPLSKESTTEIVEPAQELLTTNDPANYEYKLTPANLIENIALIGDEPIVFELLKPLTVQSLVINYAKLIEFLTINFPNTPNGINKMHSDINLMEHHDDSLYLSKVLIILTINLSIGEILIKLKKQKFKNFIKYPKKNLMFRNYKNFKNLCHLKCIEIFALIEKNFIYPPIMPQNTLKNINNINLNNANQYQIFYNLSLGYLHLCNYYHTLNLTNTLNSTSNSSNDNNYGNEVQEYHKLINLRKSITYFQLINIKTSGNSIVVQLYELFETLFTFERFYMIYSSNNYNNNLVRNNDNIILLNSKLMLKNKLENINNSFNSNILFELLCIINDEEELQLAKGITKNNIMQKLTKFTNFNISPSFLPLNYSPSTISDFLRLKRKITNLTNNDSIFEIIKIILVFKLILIIPMNFAFVKSELFELMKFANHHLARSDTDLFKLQMSNYQLLPPLLHILKIGLALQHSEREGTLIYDSTCFNHFETVKTPWAYHIDDDVNEIMIRLSDNLIAHFPFFNNINKLIRSTTLLNDWFLKLNENRYHLEEMQKVKKSERSQLPPNPNTTSAAHANSSALFNDLLLELETSKLGINSETPPVTSSTMGSKYPTPELNVKHEEHFPSENRRPTSAQALVEESRSGASGSSSSSGSYSARSLSNYSMENHFLEPTQIQHHRHHPHDIESHHSVPVPLLVVHQLISGGITGATPPTADIPQDINEFAVSESTNNLYNMFTQLTDDFTGATSESLTNLLQLNGSFGTDNNYNEATHQAPNQHSQQQQIQQQLSQSPPDHQPLKKSDEEEFWI